MQLMLVSQEPQANSRQNRKPDELQSEFRIASLIGDLFGDLFPYEF